MRGSRVARVIEDRQGDRTQGQYAEFLGLAQSTLSQIYSGARYPAKDVIHAFLRCFPDAAGDVGQAQLDDALAAERAGVPA